jgi:serine protease Do
VALTVAGCVAASSLSGFLGGYIANSPGPVFAAPGGGAEISYQSAVHQLAADVVASDTVMTVPAAAAVIKQTVVEITTERVTRSGRLGQFAVTGAGSGIIISGDGYIVTNYHVINDASGVTARLANGNEYVADIRAYDAKTDLALLKINATGLTPAVLGDSSTLVVGDTALAVGNPLGELGGTVTSGIISALDREIVIDGETMSLLQTDAAVNPGNSGGGLFNLRGELVGVVNAKSSGLDIDGLGFAIPINIAKAVISDLLENGYVQGRVDTGLSLVDIQSATTAMLYRVNQIGLYISKSVSDELRSGDRITALNDMSVTDLASFNAILKDRAVGDRVSVTVARGGESITVYIVLTEWRG